jgi:glycosyltransferase involved in cell wall biosynthesis
MKIGIFSWESLYSAKVGGLAPHVSELAEALAKMGHKVHVFTLRGDFGSHDQINGVDYHRVDSDRSGDIVAQMDSMCDAIYSRFKDVQESSGAFDVLHGHDWHPVSVLNRLKYEYGLAYILTLHSTEWGRNGNIWGSGLSQEISHREWLGGYESSRIIVTTKAMKEELASIYSIPESKVSIIPNGIEAGKIRKILDPGRVKERYGIAPLDPMILFCGRMSYQKGPDLLVEALPLVLKERPDARFVFIGEGDQRPRCEHRIWELGLQYACRFTGYVSFAEKQDLINASDLVCVPSRNEPFGIIVLEAWDASKPVVATEAVTIIRNFQDGILAYIQPESIAWCINRLLKDPEEMKRLALAGHRRIESEFGWDRIAEKTEALYKEVYGMRCVNETPSSPCPEHGLQGSKGLLSSEII